MSPTRITTLTISASKYLTTHPIATVLAKDWNSKTSPSTQARFDNTGFDANLTDEKAMLSALREKLQVEKFDGLLIGWCLRGYAGRTEVFERVVNLCAEEGRGARLMFSTGPADLANTILRNFGKIGDLLEP